MDDYDYLALSEGMGNTTTWNFEAVNALDNFKYIFGSLWTLLINLYFVLSWW
jgi:hypothetical protein